MEAGIFGKIKPGRRFIYKVCLSLLFLISAGCDPYEREFGLSDLESRDTAVRIMAIKWAGDNKVKQAVPQLVDFLQDEDKAVRLYSIEALRRIAGTDYGYDYKAESSQRVAAIRRWQEYIDPNNLHNDGN
jgi:hypothetical protein